MPIIWKKESHQFIWSIVYKAPEKPRNEKNFRSHNEQLDIQDENTFEE